jgi:hypothetical protein
MSDWSVKKHNVDPKRAEAFSRGFLGRSDNAYKQLLDKEKKPQKDISPWAATKPKR